MGANPYCYFTPYEADLHSALQRLRLREFQAGRYDPALQAAHPPTYTFEQSFPPDASFPSPGAQHASIDTAIEAAGESGTGSILDIFAISDRPSLCFATPLVGRDVQAVVGTDKPTHADINGLIWRPSAMRSLPAVQVQRLMKFWEPIGRGEARILIVYENNAPAELFFAGMSID